MSTEARKEYQAEWARKRRAEDKQRLLALTKENESLKKKVRQQEELREDFESMTEKVSLLQEMLGGSK